MTRLTEDHHVHSTFSNDGTSPIEENLAVAHRRGLSAVTLADHVRSTTTWLPEYVAAVRAADAGSPVRVRCGVEVKVLDRTGRLDLPSDGPAVDRVLIADHQYPGPDGPETPGDVRQWLEDGTLVADEVLDTLVSATAQAMAHTSGAQLAHLFSLLPKVGLDEAQVGPDRLWRLACAARDSGAVVEVNEKWACPGPAAIAAFRAAGVPLVASTDSHRASDVGRYDRVVALLASPPSGPS